MNDKELREKVANDLNSLSVVEEKREIEESDKEKVLKVLLDNKNINLKTDLNDSEILEIARLEVISNKVNSLSLAYFLNTFKELRVSKNRQGRKEIIGALQDSETKREQGFFNQFVTDLMGKRPQ